MGIHGRKSGPLDPAANPAETLINHADSAFARHGGTLGPVRGETRFFRIMP